MSCQERTAKLANSCSDCGVCAAVIKKNSQLLVAFAAVAHRKMLGFLQHALSR